MSLKHRTKQNIIILVLAVMVAILMVLSYFLNLVSFHKRKFWQEESLKKKEIQEKRGLIMSKSITADDPRRGPEDAKVTIVSFEDFECPVCKASQGTLQALEQMYPQQVAFVYRDFPITQIHKQAQLSAEAGECAADQNLFWPYHDLLFQKAPELSLDNLKDYARDVGLDLPVFQNCLETGVHSKEVSVDLLDGVSLGVVGTPTYFVNGFKIQGDLDLNQWVKLINLLLVEE